MKIIKSSGIAQEFDKDKIMQVLNWAYEDIDITTDLDMHDLFERIQPHLKDGMTTKEIQDVVVKIAADSITLEEQDYQYVASNLAQFGLRKNVYGQFDPPKFYQHIKTVSAHGVYDKEILSKYSKEEIEFLDKHIDHDRDFNLTYAGTSQLMDKYLVKDRSTGKIFETPQFMYMLIAMCLHQEEPQELRLQTVIDFYDACSNGQISLPTPILAGVRTPTRQFSSCVLIESGDSLESINATTSAIVKYVAKRAGIGVNGGQIRAEGEKIGVGEVKHTGITPFWKHFNTGTHSCSQGGIRKGSANIFYPAWHLELENLIVLKNNKGIEENRIRDMDYGIQFNNLLIDRYLDDEYITLFSPNVHPELYDAYFENPQRFKELYEELEYNPNIRKKRIKARTLWEELFATERSNTARIYPMQIDNTNDFGPWIREIAPVKQSNLCMEIALHTKALSTYVYQDFAIRKDFLREFLQTYGTIGAVIPSVNTENWRRINDEKVSENEFKLTIQEDKGEIALCTLSAFVLGSFDWRNQNEVNKIGMAIVRSLDNLLDYQDYPHKNALPAKEYRSLGVGVTNYAAWLASECASYEDANELTHELFERLQYSLIKASIQLAKEKGPSPRMHLTKYGRGELPIDWYCKNVDELVKPVYVCDWESLRCDLIKYGIRNVTLSALMPCESSSQVTNSTNGIEPPRQPITAKSSKSGIFNQVVPKYADYKLFYDFAWDLTKRAGNKPYLTQCAIMQKWVDQSISSNTYYMPSKYENGKVPMSEIMDDILFIFYYGGKTMYYHNTDDGSGEDNSTDCEGCKL